MRVFQFHNFYGPYLLDFDRRFPGVTRTYQERLRLLLADRFQAVHILDPIYREDRACLFTVANDRKLQEQWAHEHRFRFRNLTEILLAQIEDCAADVVYSLDPVAYNSEFVARLPGSVKHTVCWRAAPEERADFSKYDLRVCNFPSILSQWRHRGLRSAWFSPSHDPAMVPYAEGKDRQIDVAFAGQVTEWHTRRNRLLEAVAEMSDRVTLALMQPQRWRPLINARGLRRIPSFRPYIPAALRKVARPPVFGLDLYDLFGKSKIVINAAIDMAGQDRGNMRCFEAMGCASCMVSDAGIYPDNFRPGRDFEVFTDEADLQVKLSQLLTSGAWREMGESASSWLATTYPKAHQWCQFQKLIEAL